MVIKASTNLGAVAALAFVQVCSAVLSDVDDAAGGAFCPKIPEPQTSDSRCILIS